MVIKTPPAIVYMFVAPSGQTYVGQHRCYHATWPDVGTGALPDGYQGCSLHWAGIMDQHQYAVLWVILRRFPAGAPQEEIDMAERAGIKAARNTYGDNCVNIMDGGLRFNGATARKMLSHPTVIAKRDRRSEALDAELQRIIDTTPGVRAVIAEQETRREAQNQPHPETVSRRTPS